MKKYISPAVEIQQTEAFEMIALSLKDGKATANEVLSRDLNIWGDEEDEDEF